VEWRGPDMVWLSVLGAGRAQGQVAAGPLLPSHPWPGCASRSSGEPLASCDTQLVHTAHVNLRPAVVACSYLPERPAKGGVRTVEASPVACTTAPLDCLDVSMLLMVLSCPDQEAASGPRSRTL